MTTTKRPDGGELKFGYTNWRGETSHRRAIPISVRYGASEYHKRDQWLMLAFDLDKDEEREFAMDDMILVVPASVMPLATPANESPAPQAEAITPFGWFSERKPIGFTRNKIIAETWEREGAVLQPVFAHAPQPPVEGLVPVYVKKWRTLIMVPPSIRDEINADIAALASPSLTAGWQPIETAPKDGTNVLIAEDARGSTGEAYYDGENNRWYWANTACGDYPDPHEPFPTHWQSLPAALATLIEQSGQEETQTAKHTSSRTEASATETAGGSS